MSKALEIPKEVWIELIIGNEICGINLLNLCLSCKFFSSLLSNQQLHEYIQKKRLFFGEYPDLQASKTLRTSIAWSAQGRWLAHRAGFGGGHIYIFDPKKGLLFKMIENVSAYTIIFHPHDPDILLVANKMPNELQLWSVEKGTFSKLQDFQATRVAFHPNGKIIAALGYSSDILLVDSERCECIQKLINVKFSKALHFTNNGKEILNFTFDNQMLYWGVETGQLIERPPKEASFVSLTKDPSVMFFISQTRECMYFYNLEKQVVVKEFVVVPDNLFSVKKYLLHPSQNLVGLLRRDGIQLWDLHSNKQITMITSEDLDDFAFNPDGRALVIAERQKKLIVRNIEHFL